MASSPATRTYPSAIRYIDVNGARLRICDEGDGPPLLMINGIGATIEVWDPLKRLLPGRRLISFDAPGTGASSRPARSLRMHHVADLVAGILDQVQCDRVDVLGYSLGGMLAQQFAHQHPTRVRRLILAGTIPGLGGIQNPLTILRTLDPRLLNVRSHSRRDRVSRLVGGRSGADAAALAVYERNRTAVPPSPGGHWLQLRSLIGWSSLPWLHTLAAPTLVLAGEHDPLVPIANSRIFARLIPDCRRLTVKGGGHLFLVDQPEDVVGAIDEFLGAAPAPRPSRARGLVARLGRRRRRAAGLG